MESITGETTCKEFYEDIENINTYGQKWNSGDSGLQRYKLLCILFYGIGSGQKFNSCKDILAEIVDKAPSEEIRSLFERTKEERTNLLISILPKRYQRITSAKKNNIIDTEIYQKLHVTPEDTLKKCYLIFRELYFKLYRKTCPDDTVDAVEDYKKFITQNGGVEYIFIKMTDEKSLPEFIESTVITVHSHELTDLLKNGVKQIILTGAPGTGKSFWAKRAAQELAEESAIDFVQFHPSYDYTDFVEGLRPVSTGSDSSITFQKMDGIFKSFCRKAGNKNLLSPVNRNESKYFFIIDEINRSDLSKVFGELMYCLEIDKRGKKNGIKTQYQNLPTYKYNEDTDSYVPLKRFNQKEFNLLETEGEKEDYLEKHDIYSEKFYIPENIYIIGTMNDIDRSVESMDFALRRRFMWKEFEVTGELLKSAFESKKSASESKDSDEKTFFHKTLHDYADDAAARIMDLNRKIIANGTGKSMGLNKQYYISQGQFANLPENIDRYDLSDIDELFRFVWDTRLESLLRDYVRGEDSGKIDKFISDCQELLKIKPKKE